MHWMPSANMLNLDQSALVIVDLQAAFDRAISDFDRLVERATTMVRAAKLLSLPIIISEQVPAKLGHTAELLRSVLGDVQPIEKTVFSAVRTAGFVEKLVGRNQILLCGIETHICVNQTALDLLAMNCQVHLLIDAIGSRHRLDHEAGLAKMQSSGVIPSSVEMSLFELMGDSVHDRFRDIQRLVK